MNSILRAVHPHRPKRALLKRMVWTAARSCAMSGLYPGRLGEHWLRVERRFMPLTGLGRDLAGATIAHISDLHCSPIVRERYLHQCVERVNALEVDFVAITGDFVTGPRKYARRVARVLKELSPKIATVACLGNHDYGVLTRGGLGGVRGLGDYTAERLGQADIFVMLNECRTFRYGQAEIQFVGVEDYWSGRYNPRLAFEMVRPGIPTIALCHNPDAAEQVAALGPQWILSGHTHGTPFSKVRLHDYLLRPREMHFTSGHYELSTGGNLYVNRGLSYGRRVLLNACPEITLFTLTVAGSEDKSPYFATTPLSGLA